MVKTQPVANVIATMTIEPDELKLDNRIFVVKICYSYSGHALPSHLGNIKSNKCKTGHFCIFSKQWYYLIKCIFKFLIFSELVTKLALNDSIISLDKTEKVLVDNKSLILDIDKQHCESHEVIIQVKLIFFLVYNNLQYFHTA